MQSLVTTLQAAGHTVSVILPHTQRSWIGKAHIVGQPIKPTYFRPGPLYNADKTALHNSGTTSLRPLPSNSSDEEWVLIDSTPASCVQIGLHHYFKSRGPIDLVVSGPNYGRNTTAVFSLSSGTIGGAMEGAVCGKRSIALSYAFFDRNHDPKIISEASSVSAKLIDYLYKNWSDGVHLYSVNVPLVAGIAGKKILWTTMLQNAWTTGSSFDEIEVPEGEDQDPDEAEIEIRKTESNEGTSQVDNTQGEHERFKHVHFKWAPKFTDVYNSVLQSEGKDDNDGWTVKEGNVRYISPHLLSDTLLISNSVTPLRANFMHVDGFKGEIKL